MSRHQGVPCYQNHGRRAVIIIGTAGNGGGWPVCLRHVPHMVRVARRWSRDDGTKVRAWRTPGGG